MELIEKIIRFNLLIVDDTIDNLVAMANIISMFKFDGVEINI